MINEVLNYINNILPQILSYRLFYPARAVLSPISLRGLRRHGSCCRFSLSMSHPPSAERAATLRMEDNIHNNNNTNNNTKITTTTN